MECVKDFGEDDSVSSLSRAENVKRDAHTFNAQSISENKVSSYSEDHHRGDEFLKSVWMREATVSCSMGVAPEFEVLIKSKKLSSESKILFRFSFPTVANNLSPVVIFRYDAFGNAHTVTSLQ